MKWFYRLILIYLLSELTFEGEGNQISIKINSEDDLVVFLGKKFKTSTKLVYPKVDILSRSTKISPDIDLLIIDSDNNKIIGYETKLLRYIEKWRRYDYNSIYMGIGEALLYFQYGIDQVYLCIAVELYDSVLKEHKEHILKKLKSLKDSFNFSMLNNIIGIDIMELHSTRYYYKNLFSIERGLCKLPKSHERNKKLLLEKEFHYEKKAYKKIYG